MAKLWFPILLLVLPAPTTSHFCGLDLLGICNGLEAIAESLDGLPERIAKASEAVLDHFFDKNFGPAVDKLTAAAKAIMDRGLEDYKDAVKYTENELEIFARKVVSLAEELAKDVTKDVEEIVDEVEKDMVEGFTQIISEIDTDVNKLLTRLEHDGKELFCAATGYVDTFEKTFSAYFSKQDCGCVQSMLHDNPGLVQDCECTSCFHIGGWYTKCPCKPWGLKFAPGWYNRGKYQYLKCHLTKPIDWNNWNVDQILAQLAIIQDAALTFRCLEDLLPGSTANRDYFASEYLNVTHTILVWSSGMPAFPTRRLVDDSFCTGKSVLQCMDAEMTKVQLAQTSVSTAKTAFDHIKADLAVNGANKTDVEAWQQELEGHVAEAADSVPVGTIIPLAHPESVSEPAGLLPCNGALLSRSNYSDLFRAIGTAFGEGDKVTTFALPDLRGRTMIGAGQGRGMSARHVGERGGAENHVLSLDEMTAHEHEYNQAAGMSHAPQYAAVANHNVVALGKFSTAHTGVAGGGLSHNNMQPFGTVSLYIKAQRVQTSPSLSSQGAVQRQDAPSHQRGKRTEPLVLSSDPCLGKSLRQCATDAMASLRGIETDLVALKADFDRTTASIVANFSKQSDLAAAEKQLNAEMQKELSLIPLGAILSLGRSAAVPPGFAECDGRQLSRSTYKALFAVINTTWGAGDQKTTFGLPDLRGRTLVGYGQGTAGKIGEVGGAETHVLSVSEMPAHQHTYPYAAKNVDVWTYAAAQNGDMPEVSAKHVPNLKTGIVGKSTAHNNMQPFVTMSFYMRVKLPGEQAILETHRGAEVMLPRPFDSAGEVPVATGCSGKTIPECASEARAQVEGAEQSLMDAREDFRNSTAAITRIYSTKKDVNATVAHLERVIKGAAAMVPVGTILTLGASGRKAPDGFALCDGSPLSRAAYSELFGTIGTTWGAGDQVTTFNVPDLRGRSMVGAGQGESLTARKVGDHGGEESHLLVIAEVPKHQHLYSNVSTPVTVWQYAAVGTGHFPATLSTATASTLAQGKGQAHSNTQPYAVAAFYIKVGTPHIDQVILI